VKLDPSQTVPLFTVISGGWFTITPEMAGSETQPEAFVPVTE
jgi:hypothetical protein